MNRIAIISDAHEQKDRLIQVLTTVQNMGVKTILFCGDFCAPYMLLPFADLGEINVEIVFGNNDGDRFQMAMVAREMPHVTLHGEYAALELDHKRIGMTHYPFYATAMAKSADYDLVLFGHDHNARFIQFGGCLAVNPGCLLDSKNGHPPSFATYDPFAHAATLHDLDGGILDIDALY